MFITTKMAAPMLKNYKSESNGGIVAGSMENSGSKSMAVLHSKMSKPSIADNLKVGYFSQDRASQTASSEVVEVKELTQVVRALLNDTANLKRDLMFTRQWMQTDFESRMSQKSIDLYCQINDKVKDLERTHEERMDTVRRAFRQQLSDGLKSVNQSYNRSMQTKMKSAARHQHSAAGKWQERCKQLEDNIRAHESTIRMLREKIVDLEENPANSDQLVVLQAELDDMKQEERKLHKKIERLEEGIDLKDQEVSMKNDEISSLNEKVSMMQAEMDKIQHESDDLKNAMLKERNAAKNELEQQRLEMERQMENKTKGAKDEVLALARKEAEGLLAGEKAKYQELLDQKILLEELLAKEKSKVADLQKAAKEKPATPKKVVVKDDEDSEKSKRSVIQLRAEVERLKREIDRINRAWEKKFAILQQSMHALKDESYLRTSLQRQAAQLSQVAVTYSMDNPHYPHGFTPMETTPPPIAPPKPAQKRPLPNIPAGGKGSDQFAFTTSAPSGRGTGLFSVHENDVMSDNEDLPEGCVPLPPPPEREITVDSDQLARSEKSQSHVVRVPSVTARS